MKLLLKLAVLSGVFLSWPILLDGRAFADTIGAIQSYSVPGGKGPYSIVEGADGNIWFTNDHHSSKRIWKFDRNNYNPSNPSTAFTPYDLSSTSTDIIAGPNNTIWAILALNGNIVKITSNGTVQEYSLPNIYYNGHWQNKYHADGIALGPDGLIWVFATTSVATDAVFRLHEDGTIASKYTGFPDGSDAMEAVTDYANGKVWVITRGYSSPNYYSQATYFTVDGDYDTYDLDIMSAKSGTMAPDGRLWIGGDGKKLQSIDSEGTVSSVHEVSYDVSGLWRVRFGPDGHLWATFGSGKLVRFGLDENGGLTDTYLSNLVTGGSSAYLIGLTPGSDGNMWFAHYGNNRISKIGTGTDGTGLDADGDGLNFSQEIQLGTSDFSADSDSDGLSDYTESPWFTDRDDVFCGNSCAYPNPLKKDLYVEMDWMVKPGGGGYSTKPDNSHIAPIVSAFAAKDVNLHIDLGGFGGGSEVPYNANIYFGESEFVVDFYDYKLGGGGIAEQFDNDKRFKIWRYMLFGDFIAPPYGNALAAAEAGDDDSIIAYGKLKDTYSGAMLDTKISQAIIHELGHNLCLSSERRYDAQSNQCIYEYVDNPLAPGTYESSMNYTLSILDYSDGSNGVNDHDDWTAILTGGFNDFILDSNNGGQNDYLEVTTVEKIRSQDGEVKLRVSSKSVTKGMAPIHER